jgi:hypothetical protein
VSLRIRVVLAVAAIMLFAAPAQSTVGGHTLVEVLGYDRADRKIYVVRHDQSQEGRSPELLYFVLGSKTTGRAVRVPGLGSHSKERARIDRIRKRLRTIPLSNMLDVKWRVDTLRVDWMGSGELRKRRRHLRVRLSRWDFDKTLEMRTYCDGAVRLAALYQLEDAPSPKEAPALAIVAFRGDPTETCYEVQTPVLLTPGLLRLEGIHER